MPGNEQRRDLKHRWDDDSSGRHPAADAALSVLRWIVVAAGSTAVLITALGLIFGWQPAIVRTGSMAPAIPTGSVVLLRPVDLASIKVGEVVGVREGAKLIFHRVVSVTPADPASVTLVLKGDANEAADPAVTVTKVYRSLATLPAVAQPLTKLNGPMEQFFMGLLAGGLVAFYVWRRLSSSSRDTDEAQMQAILDEEIAKLSLQTERPDRDETGKSQARGHDSVLDDGARDGLEEGLEQAFTVTSPAEKRATSAPVAAGVSNVPPDHHISPDPLLSPGSSSAAGPAAPATRVGAATSVGAAPPVDVASPIRRESALVQAQAAAVAAAPALQPASAALPPAASAAVLPPASGAVVPVARPAPSRPDVATPIPSPPASYRPPADEWFVSSATTGATDSTFAHPATPGAATAHGASSTDSGVMSPRLPVCAVAADGPVGLVGAAAGLAAAAARAATAKPTGAQSASAFRGPKPPAIDPAPTRPSSYQPFARGTSSRAEPPSTAGPAAVLPRTPKPAGQAPAAVPRTATAPALRSSSTPAAFSHAPIAAPVAIPQAVSGRTIPLGAERSETSSSAHDLGGFAITQVPLPRQPVDAPTESSLDSPAESFVDPRADWPVTAPGPAESDLGSAATASASGDPRASDRLLLESFGVPRRWTEHLQGPDRFNAILRMLQLAPELGEVLDLRVVAVIGAPHAVQRESHRIAVDLQDGPQPRPVLRLPMRAPAASEPQAGAGTVMVAMPGVLHGTAVVGIECPDGAEQRGCAAIPAIDADLVVAVLRASRPQGELMSLLGDLNRPLVVAFDGPARLQDVMPFLAAGVPVLRVDGVPLDRVSFAALLCGYLNIATGVGVSNGTAASSDLGVLLDASTMAAATLPAGGMEPDVNLVGAGWRGGVR